MKRCMILLMTALMVVLLPIAADCQDSSNALVPDDIMFGASWNGSTDSYGFTASARYDLGGAMFAVGSINALYAANGGGGGLGVYIFNRNSFTVGLFGGAGMAVLTASKVDLEHNDVTYVEGQTGTFLAWRPSDNWPGVALYYLYTNPIRENAHNAVQFAFLGLWVPIG